MLSTISIIIPMYNCQEYIKECVESVLNQSYSNLEILLINDGSTDDTEKICQRLSDSDNRIVYRAKKNEGPSETRNVGIDMAKGEYLMFVDADDLLNQNACQKMITVAENSKSDFVISSHVNISNVTKSYKKLFKENELYFQGMELKEQIIYPIIGPLKRERKLKPQNLDRMIPIWSRLYKTAIIQENQIRFYSLKDIPSECLQFNLDYTLNCSKAAYIDADAYYYRRNTDDSFTKGYRKDLLQKWDNWHQIMENKLNDGQFGQEAEQAFINRLVFSAIPLGGNSLRQNSKKEVLDEMREILHSDLLADAFRQFDFSNLDSKWIPFFFIVKKKNVHLYYWMTKLMRYLMNRRKR